MSDINTQEIKHVVYDAFLDHCDKRDWRAAKRSIRTMKTIDPIEASGLEAELKRKMQPRYAGHAFGLMPSLKTLNS